MTIKTLRKVARTIPWGYKIDPNDPQLLVSVPEMLVLLKLAKKAWESKTSTQDSIAVWLSAKSGVPITRMGLKKRLFQTQSKLRKRANKVDV